MFIIIVLRAMQVFFYFSHPFDKDKLIKQITCVIVSVACVCGFVAEELFGCRTHRYKNKLNNSNHLIVIVIDYENVIYLHS